MVFDAGSSHTSLFVYEWDSDKENDTGVVSQTLSCDVQGQYPPAMGLVLPCVSVWRVGWPGPPSLWEVTSIGLALLARWAALAAGRVVPGSPLALLHGWRALSTPCPHGWWD